MTLYGSTAHGSNADYQLVADHMCVPMPEELSFEEGAACSCGTGTACQALRRLGVSRRDTLVVFGQGPVGLSATMLGVTMGALAWSLLTPLLRDELLPPASGQPR